VRVCHSATRPSGTLTIAAGSAPPDRTKITDTIDVRWGRDAFVGVLQRFERRLGGLVEGAFAKVFKGDVQPVEIASAGGTQPVHRMP